MAIKEIYINAIAPKAVSKKNSLDFKRYQRNVNFSKKVRPSLDSFKFSRDCSIKENEKK